MPASVERCVKKLMAQGKTENQAWAICQASYAKSKRKGRSGR